VRSAQFAFRNSQRSTIPGPRMLRIAYCPLREEWSSARRAGSTGDWGLGTGDYL